MILKCLEGGALPLGSEIVRFFKFREYAKINQTRKVFAENHSNIHDKLYHLCRYIWYELFLFCGARKKIVNDMRNENNICRIQTWRPEENPSWVARELERMKKEKS